MKFYLPLICAATLLASCGNNADKATTTGAAPATSSASVADLDQQFLSAWNGKDAAKASALLADDVQFLQGETRFSGKSEVMNKWITPTITTISGLKTSVVSSGNDANTAYEAGTFSVDVLPTATDNTAGTGAGNFIFLWKKGGDGNWKLSYAQLEDLPVRANK
ncbi:YybH family protein [Hymenobacter bucti]|uniref:YybH family protein n=1 Tax=Hymenobacter bucti TaxID=1844114 RepID=A0ABW4QQ49_9BACT